MGLRPLENDACWFSVNTDINTILDCKAGAVINGSILEKLRSKCTYCVFYWQVYDWLLICSTESG